MTETSAANRHSNIAMRKASAAPPFGSLAAIAPHFDGLPAAEQKAAIALMLEGGERLATIAARLKRDEAAIETLRGVHCRRIVSQGENDQTETRVRAALLARPVQKAMHDQAVNEALVAIDTLRALAGGAGNAPFEMTLEALGEACGFSPDTARRRLRELESRGWIRRTIRAGQPPLLNIAPAGRSRLTAIVLGNAS